LPTLRYVFVHCAPCALLSNRSPRFFEVSTHLYFFFTGRLHPLIVICLLRDKVNTPSGAF
jgi:hypothetical protein